MTDTAVIIDPTWCSEELPCATATALRARVAKLEQAAFSWLAYDQLLRAYAGPKDMLCEGDFALADKTYDECVKSTVAALKGDQL